MRHSTPNLTFAIYVHSDKSRLKAAVAALPGIAAHTLTEIVDATARVPAKFA